MISPSPAQAKVLDALTGDRTFECHWNRLFPRLYHFRCYWGGMTTSTFKVLMRRGWIRLVKDVQGRGGTGINCGTPEHEFAHDRIRTYKITRNGLKAMRLFRERLNRPGGIAHAPGGKP